VSPELALLGDIATLQAGFGFPPSLQGRTNGRYPFAKVGDISRGGRSESSILSKADNYVDAADVPVLRAKIVPPGSILFAKIGEAIRQNHRVVAGCEMLIDNNAMAAIPNGKQQNKVVRIAITMLLFTGPIGACP
jgi:type I restriction enzyme S subunit